MAKIKFLIRLFLRDFRLRSRHGDYAELSADDKKFLKTLDADGLFAIRGFLPAEDIAACRKELELLLTQKDIKIWADKVESDRRIYGANKKSSTIEKYYKNQFINKMLDAYQKSHVKSGFTMAAKMVYKPNNPGSGDGWHRDNCEIKQSKSIVYLTDAGAENGPFQYVKHSHRFFYIVRDWLRYGIDPMNARISNEKMDRLIAREPERLVEVTGKAGDTLFADTRGLHRGKPIEKDLRMAMTNYFWFDTAVPEHIAKLLQN